MLPGELSPDLPRSRPRFESERERDRDQDSIRFVARPGEVPADELRTDRGLSPRSRHRVEADRELRWENGLPTRAGESALRGDRADVALYGEEALLKLPIDLSYSGDLDLQESRREDACRTLVELITVGLLPRRLRTWLR